MKRRANSLNVDHLVAIKKGRRASCPPRRSCRVRLLACERLRCRSNPSPDRGADRLHQNYGGDASERISPFERRHLFPRRRHKKSPAFRGAFSYLFTHAGARTGAIRRLVPNEYTYRAKYFFVIRSVRRRVRAKTPVQPLSVRSELTTAVPWHVSVRWASLDYNGFLSDKPLKTLKSLVVFAV